MQPTLKQILRMTWNAGRNLMQSPVLVLLYHRVANLSWDPFHLAVSPRFFDEQMRMLADHFPILGFGDDFDKVQRPSIVITFDDGYADNLQYALPVLQRYSLPATFFITTGPVEKQSFFWWDYLPRDPTLVFKMQSGFKQLSDEKRADRISKLAQRPNPSERDRALTPDEVKLLSDTENIHIGCHTHTHTALASQTVDEQREEIRRSKELLETWTGKQMKYFAYPFGSAGDFNQDSVQLVKEFGFYRAATTSWGQVRQKTDPYLMPRFMVQNWTHAEFLQNLRRFFIL